MTITGPAAAQVIVATDDSFSVQYNQPLVIDAPGILDNDLVDGEAAHEMGAVAELVTDAGHGTLTLNSDGSLTYSPGPTFEGLDSFVYATVLNLVSAETTVFLSACEGGPEVFFCWKEGAFQAMAADLGYYSSMESFEGVAWDSRDSRGGRVPAGTYFGKLKVTAGGKSGVKVRKIIILH